jgi:hypothetical protein
MWHHHHHPSIHPSIRDHGMAMIANAMVYDGFNERHVSTRDKGTATKK